MYIISQDGTAITNNANISTKKKFRNNNFVYSITNTDDFKLGEYIDVKAVKKILKEIALECGNGKYVYYKMPQDDDLHKKCKTCKFYSDLDGVCITIDGKYKSVGCDESCEQWNSMED